MATAEPAPATVPPAVGAWAPLRRAAFRALWLAALASNVGTWMHEAAGAWLMTTLAPSPLLVALMQTAASLPFFVLALPAGALADLVDRRRHLLVAQSAMAVAAGLLGMLTIAGLTTPQRLLALTAALGVGAAMNAPAWQAINAELVPARELPAAVALGGVAFNAARAVGPALGGLLLAAVGPGVVFLLNAASFLGVLAVLARWRRESPPPPVVPEDVRGALRAGLRYVRHSDPLRTILVRTFGFVVFASAVWSLLPIVAVRELGLGAVGYGLLLGCLGSGAVLGAALLPVLRARLPIDRVMAAATLLFAASAVGVALLPDARLVGAALVGGGVAWLAAISTVNAAAQTSVSAWVRARALAVSLLVVQGGMAAGAAGWGWLATRTGVPTTLLVAAGGLVVGLAVVGRFPLAATEGLDVRPAPPLPEPVVAGAVDPDDGPVLVTVEYRVHPDRADAFAAAMQQMGRIRRRDGADLWALFRDTADPAAFIETFTVASWGEHLRQHERLTRADQPLQELVRGFHVDVSPPVVRHLLAARPRNGDA